MPVSATTRSRARPSRSQPPPGPRLDAGGASAGDGRLHLGGEGDERLAAVGYHLAPEEIEPLDAGGAFVDAVELLVAQPRLGQVFARVAVAAVNLQRQRVGLEAPLGAEALGQRRQQIEELLGAPALPRIGGVGGEIGLERGGAEQRQAALDDRLLAQQHAAHVGVLDDGHLRAGGVARRGRAPLGALERVAQRLLVRN